MWKLALWVVVIVAATTLPWSNYQGHAHWGRINWLPLGAPYDRWSDMALNAALFVPLGYLYVRRSSRPWKPAAVGAGFFGAAVSAAAEFSQVFSHNRFVSATDLVMNVLGAVLGAMLAVKRRGR